MDELIGRQAAIDAANDWLLNCFHVQKQNRSCGLIRRLEDLPSAEPEIIRCKECKHWLDIDDGRQKHRMCADIYGDWFCADAERRTDEAN